MLVIVARPLMNVYQLLLGRMAVSIYQVEWGCLRVRFRVLIRRVAIPKADGVLRDWFVS